MHIETCSVFHSHSSVILFAYLMFFMNRPKNFRLCPIVFQSRNLFNLGWFYDFYLNC